MKTLDLIYITTLYGHVIYKSDTLSGFFAEITLNKNVHRVYRHANTMLELIDFLNNIYKKI